LADFQTIFHAKYLRCWKKAFKNDELYTEQLPFIQDNEVMARFREGIMQEFILYGQSEVSKYIEENKKKLIGKIKGKWNVQK